MNSNGNGNDNDNDNDSNNNTTKFSQKLLVISFWSITEILFRMVNMTFNDERGILG